MKNRLEIQDHGVMLNDYFGGTSGVMLPISIDNQTTVGQIIEHLESEINMIWDHIEYTAENNDFTGDLEKEMDREIQAIKDQNKNKLDKIHMPDLDYCFDDMEYSEYPALILTIEFLEE